MPQFIDHRFLPEPQRSQLLAEIKDHWRTDIESIIKNCKQDVSQHLYGGWTEEQCIQVLQWCTHNFVAHLHKVPLDQWSPLWVEKQWNVCVTEFIQLQNLKFPIHPELKTQWPDSTLEPDELNRQQAKNLQRQFLPYLIFFVLAIVILKFLLLWMLNQGWLYWDDGPGYQ